MIRYKHFWWFQTSFEFLSSKKKMASSWKVGFDCSEKHLTICRCRDSILCNGYLCRLVSGGCSKNEWCNKIDSSQQWGAKIIFTKSKIYQVMWFFLRRRIRALANIASPMAKSGNGCREKNSKRLILPFY